MNTYNIAEVPEDVYFSQDLFLDEKFLLLICECPVSVNLKNMLTKWDFRTVSSNGEINYNNQTSTEELTLNTIVQKTPKESSTLNSVELKCIEVLNTIADLHETAKKGKNISVNTVSNLAKHMEEFVRTKGKLILLVETSRFSEYDYIVVHEFRSTVFSLIIGNYLKLPDYKLIELATACLVHEIGMARIPAGVYHTCEPLTTKEKQALLTHPIISYNIVNASSFSLPVCLACLEHHERENGYGYPRRLTTKKISLYGKIIAVACSYEAATSTRPFREAKNPTTAIMELVRNENKQYDDSVLKALLYSISFFPIGTYVVLSDGRAAQVIDVNPDDPRFPIVQLIGETTKDGDRKILGTSKENIFISRTVTKEDALQITSDII